MTATKEEIDAFCLSMPRYKRPRKIFFATIPRNPTGKIEKPKLRQIYRVDHLVAQETGALQTDSHPERSQSE
jgi:acyl-CoA synthetase (AMP-forming)/AMP-acid ligase II